MRLQSNNKGTIWPDPCVQKVLASFPQGLLGCLPIQRFPFHGIIWLWLSTSWVGLSFGHFLGRKLRRLCFFLSKHNSNRESAVAGAAWPGALSAGWPDVAKNSHRGCLEGWLGCQNSSVAQTARRGCLRNGSFSPKNVAFWRNFVAVFHKIVKMAIFPGFFEEFLLPNLKKFDSK